MAASLVETQLAVISETVTALGDAAVPWWVAGGWAVDFLLGEVTRPHRDIDIVIWSRDAQRASAALVTAGFGQRPSPQPQELIRLERDCVPVTLSFIEREADGTLVTPGRWRDWPWPADSLDAAPGRIGDVEAPIISLAAQYTTKRDYAAHPLGAPLRPQDRADLARLEALSQ